MKGGVFMDKDLLKMAVELTNGQLNYNAISTVSKEQVRNQPASPDQVMDLVSDYYARSNKLMR